MYTCTPTREGNDCDASTSGVCAHQGSLEVSNVNGGAAVEVPGDTVGSGRGENAEGKVSIKSQAWFRLKSCFTRDLRLQQLTAKLRLPQYDRVLPFSVLAFFTLCCLKAAPLMPDACPAGFLPLPPLSPAAAAAPSVPSR